MNRIVFGVCHQYNPDDAFLKLDSFFQPASLLGYNNLVKVNEMLYTEAKGLPFARAKVNEMITDEDYVLQLDSHHRFAKNWDETLINWHLGLEAKGYKPLIAGYLPRYNPLNDPAERAMEPWQSQFACFYPFGTIFIRPARLEGWENMTEPVPARFLSGHFAFARTQWARDVKHDPNIYFSGEEINLTVRSYTHGYDLFHPPKVVVWHSTMREERSGILVWDDQSKRGVNWGALQDNARKRIRVLLGSEIDYTVDLTGYELGTARTLRDYEKYAGINFKKRAVQKYTYENKFPPNPVIEDEKEWENSFMTSFYHCIRFDKTIFKYNDYDFWVLAFDDENRIAIYRDDLNQTQIQEIMSNPGNYIGIEKFFLTEKIPVKWVVWAHRKNGDWAERIEGIV